MTRNRRLKLLISSPTKRVFERDNLLSITCRMKGTGAIQFLPGHHPLVGATETGFIRLRDENGIAELESAEGILSVEGGTVSILILDDQGETLETLVTSEGTTSLENESADESRRISSGSG